jgi:Undecaprenyl-phosphate glucose phosphotransferase
VAASAVALPVSYRAIPAAAAVVDVFVIAASMFTAEALYGRLYGWGPALPRDVATAAFVAILFVASTAMRHLYEPTRLSSFRRQVTSVVPSWVGAFLVLVSGVFAWGVGGRVSRMDTVLFFGIGMVGLLASRLAWRAVLPRVLRSGALRGPKVAVLCWDAREGAGVRDSLRRHGYSVERLDLLSHGNEEEDAARFVDSVRQSDIGEIFVVVGTANFEGLVKVTEALRVLPLPVAMAPCGLLARFAAEPRYLLGRQVAIEMQRAPMSSVEQVQKRILDVLVSSVSLVLLSPIFVATALAVKLDSKGPVFFRQKRHGFNGRPFDIYKFRSMRVTENGPVIRQATSDDPRITRIGKWLRKLSIDELPQLLNVLAGDMSVVGPRPHASAHDDYYKEVVDNYFYRHHVKAGMMGWAQVNGARGETDTVEKMQKRIDLDVWYVNNWSVLLDLLVIAKTAVVVLFDRHAY